MKWSDGSETSDNSSRTLQQDGGQSESEVSSAGESESDGLGCDLILTMKVTNLIRRKRLL